jgi:7-cyano-7-deazaguanine synthase
MTKVLLYSGGMDSWLINKLWKPDIKLYINVGTRSSIEEAKRLPDDVIIRNLPIADQEQHNNNFYLPMRNLLFVTLASYYGDIICLGATGSSIHWDNTEKFAKDASDLLTYLNLEENKNASIKVVVPFWNVSKTELLRQYLKDGGDINKAFFETFSCYNPKLNGEPCWKCLACLRKLKAFSENGFDVKKHLEKLCIM